MRKATFIGLLLSLCVAALPNAALSAPSGSKLACVYHGWQGNTPFDYVLQSAMQYTSADSGQYLSGKLVVNTGGISVCVFTIVGGGASTFSVNPDGTSSSIISFAPVAANTADCIGNFVATYQGVGAKGVGVSVETDAGVTAFGTCYPQ